MSRCVNKRGVGKFGAIPHVETCSSFFNYVSSTSLDIALKVSSSERRRVVLLMESVQISPCAFICEREESSC